MPSRRVKPPFWWSSRVSNYQRFTVNWSFRVIIPSFFRVVHPIYTIPKFVFSCPVRDIHTPNPSGDATGQTRTIIRSLYHHEQQDVNCEHYGWVIQFPWELISATCDVSFQQYDRRLFTFFYQVQKRIAEIPTMNTKKQCRNEAWTKKSVCFCWRYFC